LAFKQKSDIVRTLERMAVRKDVLNQSHLAEAISLVVWNPETGKVNPDLPDSKSILRIEKFSEVTPFQKVSPLNPQSPFCGLKNFQTCFIRIT